MEMTGTFLNCKIFENRALNYLKISRKSIIKKGDLSIWIHNGMAIIVITRLFNLLLASHFTEKQKKSETIWTCWQNLFTGFFTNISTKLSVYLCPHSLLLLIFQWVNWAPVSKIKLFVYRSCFLLPLFLEPYQDFLWSTLLYFSLSTVPSPSAYEHDIMSSILN